ncbi:MAG: HNH endonuclease, partial [Bacteroidia bacterium]|nr:HNH endonuclease [Bacteroidia bacterium]
TCIDITELLFASHIIPWSKNEQERLNPENGICLSALYDKAFDKGLITINTKHEVILSNQLKKHINKEYFKTHFATIENIKINSPDRFLPNKIFLEYHRDEIFLK